MRQQVAESDAFFARVRQRVALRDERVGRRVQVDPYSPRQQAIAAVIQQKAPGDPGEGLGTRPYVEAAGHQHVESVVLAHQLTVADNNNSPRVAAQQQFLVNHQIVQFDRVHAADLAHVLRAGQVTPAALRFRRGEIGVSLHGF